MTLTNPSKQHDLLIRGARVIDGGGSPAFLADVAVTDDRITAVGDLSSHEAGRVIVATGLTLSPGFIDVHTHDDRLLFTDPAMTPKVSQGVTTVVTGNCGISLAPGHLITTPSPLDILGEAESFCFGTFANYLQMLDENPSAVNAASLIGHTTLRVLCVADIGKPADDKERRNMRARVDEALRAGAIGLSSGLFYSPARPASTEEVIDLAMPVGEAQGIYATHLRDEADGVIDALHEALEIGRRAAVDVVLSHHKTYGRRNFGRTRETLGLITKARETQAVSLDVYPYTAASTTLNTEMWRAAERSVVTWSKSMPSAAGRDICDIAAELGCNEEQAIARIQPAGAIYFMMDERDVRRVLDYPETMIGSDGLPHDEYPHPRLWGTFTRVLGHYVREVGLFSLEEAIRRMTSLPAQRFRLSGRGRIVPRAFADLVLFDSDLVCDRADFQNPMLASDGIDTVFVNGVEVYRDRAPTGNRPGRVLRRGESHI